MAPEPTLPFPLKPGYRRVAGILCNRHGLPVCAHPDLEPGRYACLAGHLVGKAADPTEA